MTSPERPVPQRRHKRLVLLVTMAIVLLALGWLAAICYYAGIDLLLRPNSLGLDSAFFGDDDPETRKRFEIWYSQPITFPPEALHVEPVSEDFVRAEEKAQAEFDKVSYLQQWLNGSTYDTLYQGNAEENLNNLKQLDSTIRAFDAFVNHRDFQGYGDFTNLLAAQAIAKAMRLRTAALMHDGRQQDALSMAETIARASMVNPYEGMLQTVIALAVKNIGTDAWMKVVEQCDDPVLLRESLRAQNKIAGQMWAWPETIPFDVLVELGYFRQEKRRQPNLKISLQGLTGREILAVKLRIWKPSEVKRFIRVLERDWPIPVPEALAKQLPFIAYSQNSPAKVNEAPTWNKAACARFETLRVLTASRIYELETGQAPKSMQDLVPEYLPEIPPDPFAPQKASIVLDPIAGPYSIGPDQKDNEGKIAYDPTNGTLSQGDLIRP